MNIEELKKRLHELGYDDGQIAEIVHGIENDVDVSVYSKKDYDSDQMKQIRIGLMHNLYVSEYANPKLSADQMWIIRHAMEYGSTPVKLAGSFRHMIASYIAKLVEVDDSLCASMTSDKLFVFIDGARDCIDMSDVPSDELNAEQMYEILQARKAELDDQKLLRRQSDGCFMSAAKMKEIRTGLSADIDLLSVCTTDFSASQMREARFGLEEGVNVEVYCKPEFSAAQMRQVRLGMQVDVDVTVYADPKRFSAGIMRVIRHGLTEGVHPSLYLKDEMTTDEASAALQSILNMNENVHDSDGGIALNADYLSHIINEDM